MVVHDYPVRRLTLEDLERRASDFRAKCGIAPGCPLDVYALLFNRMPDYLQKLGLNLVERTTKHMGEREAYAAPKAKRIFFRASLLARLKFGDPTASLIFLHELAHVLLHRDNGGAEKAWLQEENRKVAFVGEEESAEWQATVLALCIKAPENDAKDLNNSKELEVKFGLDDKHAAQRFELIRRRQPRKVPEIYHRVRSDLINHSLGSIQSRAEMNPLNVARLCPICGQGSFIDIGAKYYCSGCRLCSSKLQDGDSIGVDPASK